MSDEVSLADEPTPTEPEDLKPKKPSNRAPEGIRTFTVCRQNDETGISGEGVVIEGGNICYWAHCDPLAHPCTSRFDCFF